MERESVTIVVFEAERWDGEWPPENARDAIAWFQAKLDEVPEEWRGSARIELSSTSDYDSHCATIRISYTRPQTDAEIKDRIARREAEVRWKEDQERAALAALKKKYEG